jgi:hypothetical protein
LEWEEEPFPNYRLTGVSIFTAGWKKLCPASFHTNKAIRHPRAVLNFSHPGHCKSLQLVSPFWGPAANVTSITDSGATLSGKCSTPPTSLFSSMLSRCANSQCSKPFLRLGEGKLFLVETERITKLGEAAEQPLVGARRQARVVEHYWLCGDCATVWTLVYDQNHAIALGRLGLPSTGAVPLSPIAQKVPTMIRHFVKITRTRDGAYHLVIQDGDRRIEEEIDGPKLVAKLGRVILLNTKGKAVAPEDLRHRLDSEKAGFEIVIGIK